MIARRALLFCCLSALGGTLVGALLTGTETTTSQSVAQEFPRTAPVGPLAGARFSPAPSGAGVAPSYTEEERVNIAVYESANKSVVNISTKSVRGDGFFWQEIASEGEGSGIVVDRQGHILTNSHVVEDAQQVLVTLYDGKSYEAQLVGKDLTNDMAVLAIKAPSESLFPVEFGDSSNLLVGQRVFAIGNPFGLERTLSTGIVASLNRTMPSRSEARTIKQIIQIDAAINPGSSGGPLLDTGGRMIGMNTAIASRTGESAGVGFAIPVNTIARIVPQLIENGRVLRPSIGIAAAYQTEEGLLIVEVDRAGAAKKAGLRGFSLVRRQKRIGPSIWEQTVLDRSTADLIIGVGGQRIHTWDEFLSIIEGKQAGDKIVVNVIRDGQQVGVPVTLEGNE
jgi:S1-C subfamily serine protease